MMYLKKFPSPSVASVRTASPTGHPPMAASCFARARPPRAVTRPSTTCAGYNMPGPASMPPHELLVDSSRGGTGPPLGKYENFVPAKTGLDGLIRASIIPGNSP